MAEDILHTTYLKILEGKANFDERSSFKTWLFAVIRNTAHGTRRRLFNRLETLTAKFWSPSTSEGDTEKSLYRSEIQTCMREMMEKLSARQREVLQLVFYHELTIEDSARIMGVSVGSARTHYQRAKDRLRSQLEEAGISR
jgi:RNA polymerase sigma-70 factor (ECF subfamily)